jgi:hypothetical protein
MARVSLGVGPHPPLSRCGISGSSACCDKGEASEGSISVVDVLTKRKC